MGERRLRATQVETLELIADAPDQAVWTSDIAQWAHRSIRAAEQRLQGLLERGLVTIGEINWGGRMIELRTLTDAGRDALAPHPDTMEGER